MARQRPCFPPFHDLPDDVLILIFSSCQIDSLLTVRLTSKRFLQITTRYLVTIAPSCARTTFPACEYLFKKSEAPSKYTLQWLKGLIPKQLASILVDRHRFSHEWSDGRYGIPAADAYGDVLRSRIENGWCVLGQLSNISKEIYRLDADLVVKPTNANRAWKLIKPSGYDFEVLQKREGRILERRLEYVGRLSENMIRDYKLMFMLLSSVFRTVVTNHGEEYKPWIFDWGCGIDGRRLLRRGNSWLTWFILHQGPDLFWQQWWALDPTKAETKHYIRDLSIHTWIGKSKKTPEDIIQQCVSEEWRDVDQRWHNTQRDYAYYVQKAVDERIKAMDLDFTAINPIMYFTQYAEIRQSREESGAAPILETLAHVPFNVDFRCPEELFQRFSLVKEEKAFLLPSEPREARED